MTATFLNHEQFSMELSIFAAWLWSKICFVVKHDEIHVQDPVYYRVLSSLVYAIFYEPFYQ